MTISEIIFRNLPFLNTITDEAKVTGVTQEVLIIMQKLWETPVADADVLNEAVYSELQKLVIAYYTCYNLTFEKSVATVGGVNGEQANNRVVVSQQAAVVSQSYKVLSKEEGFGTNLETMLKFFKEKACTLANRINASLPICERNIKQYSPMPVYFIKD